MGALNAKPEAEAPYAAGKRLAAPLLGIGTRRQAIRARRRVSATRLARSTNDGFRLFRVH